MFKMIYCPECGTRLTTKMHETDGETPYCETCGDFRFPIFSTAVSMICTNEARDRILLISQYGTGTYVLVAGYVNKGEDAEDTCIREMQEEMGLHIRELHFNHSHYFRPSNTLMLNFTVVVDDAEIPCPNEEIDDWAWMSVEEARQKIRPNSLAKQFLEGYCTKEYHFDGEKR